MNKYNIIVIGCGYVGLSNALLLSQNNNVTILDILEAKINQINNKISPIKDKYLEEFLFNNKLNLKATTNPQETLLKADYIIIATPTNYNENTQYFDTQSIEQSIQNSLKYNKKAAIIIKSTIPIGYTKILRKKYKYNKILFCPEFLREGQSLQDLLYPDRIIIGCENSEKQDAQNFIKLLQQSAKAKNVPVLYTGLSEAESIKLFANSYLAMRVSFFNELDTFAELKNLNTKDIIEGIGLDKRIGLDYNNPSFGYGGYCFPKDTKQLLSNYNNIPQNLFSAIVNSNQTRKEFIENQILSRIENIPKPTIGIYRVTMKTNSDNFRQSAIWDIITNLQKKEINIIIYEPYIKENNYNNFIIENNFNDFINKSDLIIANRIDDILSPYSNKVYSRDIFSKD